MEIVKKQTSFWSNLMLAVMLLFITSCGDDITNNYYPKEEPVTPPTEEEPAPDYEIGNWIREVFGLCYYGYEPNSLFPGWLLQAEGAKQAYGDSPFAQEFITEDLLMVLRNPGAGAHITLRMDDGDINHASTYEYVVGSDETDELLELQLPVDWDYNALLTWDTDRMVKLKWTLAIAGREVDRYAKTFNCRSLRCYCNVIGVSKQYEAPIMEEMKNLGFGSYPTNEDDDYLYLRNEAFIMGYIDEHSPIIERMKHEVIEDGLVDYLLSWGGGSDIDFINSSSLPFSYLMLKYRIAYTIRQGGYYQYIRTIDEIFGDKQGYCMEFAIAFASWCLNQGIPCTLESVPDHMVNNILGAEDVYPVDMTQLSSDLHNQAIISEFSKPLSKENVATFQDIHQKILEDWRKIDEEEYKPGREEGIDFTYHSYNIIALRPLLPSFNIGNRYVQTRTVAPVKQIRKVDNLLWKKMVSTLQENK